MEENQVQVETNSKTNGKKNLLIASIILAFILILIFSFTFGSKEARLMRIAEEGIRDGLAYNADEAEFSGRAETGFFFYGDNEEYVKVTGWVIASNGYGAKSKVTYQAELEKDDRGQWVFDSFWLNE